MLFPVDQRHLFPVALLAARRLVDLLDILAQFMAVLFVPVGNTDHLVDVVPLAANLLFDDDAVLHAENPVIRALFPDPEEIGGVLVGLDDGGIGKKQVRLKHIRAGQQVTGHQR